MYKHTGDIITNSPYARCCRVFAPNCCVLAPTGKTLVPSGGSCVDASGKYDITKTCNTATPVCMSPGSGKCVTTEEASKPPAPAPAPAVCASYSNLGQPCDEAKGKCCGGAPKNAKCTGGTCVSTYPSGRRMAV